VQCHGYILLPPDLKPVDVQEKGRGRVKFYPLLLTKNRRVSNSRRMLEAAR
jgi:hypothetical protein